MTTIAAIAARDWPDVLRMAAEFYAEAKLPGTLNPDVFRRNWSTYIARGYGVILVLRRDAATVGAIGGFIVRDPSNDDLVAAEGFWFVTEHARGAGLRLFTAFETLARVRGCKRLTFVHLHALQSERLGALYQRRGFSPIEHHYVKEL